MVFRHNSIGDSGSLRIANLCLLARRTLLAGKKGLEDAKSLLIKYKNGEIKSMTPELWKAKKVVDSTLHPGMERHK